MAGAYLRSSFRNHFMTSQRKGHTRCAGRVATSWVSLSPTVIMQEFPALHRINSPPADASESADCQGGDKEKIREWDMAGG